MKNLGIFFLLFALAFTACRKDINDVNEVTTTPDPVFLDNYVPTFIQVNGDITGFIVDENNEPIQDAQVKMGDFMTTTDQFGHFFFTNTSMNAAGTIVQVEKAGYFAGSRRFNAVADVKNRIKIELIPKNFNQSFASQDGGTINLNEGGSITFAPNSIQNADGTPYTGTVKVASEWLDPSKTATLNQMPGSLFAVNNRGEEVVLGTFGMVAVELESETGEPLNILKGNTAELRMAVPSNMQSEAPAEIPLWSYNEEFGVWVEESVATLTNGYYVGDVTHFSVWNCDINLPMINFTAMFTDQNGNPLEDYAVRAFLQDTVFVAGGNICDDGTLAGNIPANEVVTFQVLGLCAQVLYTQSFGPFASDADLGTIVVNDVDLDPTTLIGTLVDCDNNPVNNGVLVINSGFDTFYEYITGGAFNIITSPCSVDDFEIVGYDLDNLQQSEVVLATGSITNNLGDIVACEDIADFVTLTVDGVTATYVADISVSKDPNSTYIEVYHQTGYMGFGFSGVTVGTYDSSNEIELLDDTNYGWSILSNTGFDTFEVTEYGNVGEAIIGTFGGMMTNTDPGGNTTTVEVSGSFQVTNPN